MKYLKLKPNNTLFLRDGQVFDRGENMWLRSRFFPHPSVFYGAIYSNIISCNIEKKNKLIGLKPEELKDILQINKIYIYDEEDENENLFINSPLDLFKNDRGEIKFGELEEIKENSKVKKILCPPSNSYKRVDGEYIEILTFSDSYIKGNDFALNTYREDEFYLNSYKVGIEKNKSRNVAEDDSLYRMDLSRFKSKDLSYLVEYEIKDETLSFSNEGFLKLGGEGKTCKYKVLNEKTRPYSINGLEKKYKQKCSNNKVKIVLTSPAIFTEHGWKPNFEGDIKIIYSSIGKPVYIGGFDMYKKRPKPMYKAVPSGSVYVLESDLFVNKKLMEIKDILDKNIKDSLDTFRGFGKFEVMEYKED